jgi:hypothetical protein
MPLNRANSGCLSGPSDFITPATGSRLPDPMRHGHQKKAPNPLQRENWASSSDAIALSGLQCSMPD